MRAATIIAVFTAMLCLLGGCDFFRQLAGRPTSRDIAAKRVQIEQEAVAHQRRLDSLKAVQKQISDSLATLDSLRNAKEALVSSKHLSSVGQVLPYRYYVLIGTFGSPGNADRQAARAEAAGYPATLIPLRNGFTAVGISPSNSLIAVSESLKIIQRESFCPSDACILNNE
jgi:hypothetical protein